MRSAFTFLFCAAFPLCGQILQSHPEYCGLPGGPAPAIPDISGSIDPVGQHIVLHLGRDRSAPTVRLPGSWIAEVPEACPLSDWLLVVFGSFGGIDITIVDVPKAAVVDHIIAYEPVSISPDRRWLVYSKFWPLHGSAGADELMLYDLHKTPVQNRAEIKEGAGSEDPGRLIFPPGHENFPGGNIDLPGDQVHFLWRVVYWAPDSRAMLLEDHGPDGHAIVLITLDDNGVPAQLRHRMTLAEICGGDIKNIDPNSSWTLGRGDIGPESSGGRSVVAGIVPAGDDRCVQHDLHLRSEDFRPAKVERHARPEYTRGAIVDGKEVIPPKKKE